MTIQQETTNGQEILYESSPEFIGRGSIELIIAELLYVPYSDNGIYEQVQQVAEQNKIVLSIANGGVPERKCLLSTDFTIGLVFGVVKEHLCVESVLETEIYEAARQLDIPRAFVTDAKPKSHRTLQKILDADDLNTHIPLGRLNNTKSIFTAWLGSLTINHPANR